jgi:hypothetical protein
MRAKMPMILMSILASVARMRGGAMRAFAKLTEHAMHVVARVLMSVDSPVRMPMILMSVWATVARMRGAAMRAFAKLTEHAMPVVAHVLMSVGVAIMDSPVRQLIQC